MPRILVGYRGPYVEADYIRTYFHPPEGAEVYTPLSYPIDPRPFDVCRHCEKLVAVTHQSSRVRVLACSLRCGLRMRGVPVHDDGAPKRKYTRRQVPGAVSGPTE